MATELALGTPEGLTQCIRADNKPEWARWRAGFEFSNGKAADVIAALTQIGIAAQPDGSSQIISVNFVAGRELEVATIAIRNGGTYMHPRTGRMLGL